jgi:hypothetical protein
LAPVSNLQQHRQQQVVDVDMDHTWRGVYSVARSNYGQLSTTDDDADTTVDADGPRLLLSTPQLRMSVRKVGLHSLVCKSL